MTKNIFLLIIVSILILSCGKKGDPVFNEKQSKIFSTKIRVIVLDTKEKIFSLIIFKFKSLLKNTKLYL